MLTIKSEGKFLRKLKALLLRFYYFLDNTGNCVFNTNGEEDFINKLLIMYKNDKLVIFDGGG